MLRGYSLHIRITGIDKIPVQWTLAKPTTGAYLRQVKGERELQKCYEQRLGEEEGKMMDHRAEEDHNLWSETRLPANSCVSEEEAK